MSATKKSKKKSPTAPVREARKAVALAEAVAAENIQRTSRTYAQDQLRRELATWVMGMRAIGEELHAEIVRITAECRRPESLLHGVLSDGVLARISEAGRDVSTALDYLSGVFFEVKPFDVVAIAKNYQDSWGLHPAADS